MLNASVGICQDLCRDSLSTMCVIGTSLVVARQSRRLSGSLITGSKTNLLMHCKQNRAFVPALMQPHRPVAWFDSHLERASGLVFLFLAALVAIYSDIASMLFPLALIHLLHFLGRCSLMATSSRAL